MSGGTSATAAPASPAPPSSSRRRFLSPIQLQSLATVTILAGAGLVPASDLAFAVLSIPYTYFLSAIPFPSLTPGPAPSVFGDRNPILARYVFAGAIIGLFLPIIYILEGAFSGDRESVNSAAPHLFLLSFQVFMEGVTFWQGFSIPVRAFVPVAFNSRRLFSIADWLRSELGKEGLGFRLIAGKVLAIANLVMWAFNLFGFLLPVYLPRALKRVLNELLLLI
ncbi:hypothetical protein DsansV1_C22g0172271 [Dioscorea sansibarensis]